MIARKGLPSSLPAQLLVVDNKGPSGRSRQGTVRFARRGHERRRYTIDFYTVGGPVQIETLEGSMSVRRPGTGDAVRVAAESDIAEGSGILARIGDLMVGVFRVKGQLRAYENRCQHQGGPVCTGEILGRQVVDLADDGTVLRERLSDDELHIVCPWHGWEYILDTGVNSVDPRFRLRSFAVFEQSGDVYVRV